MKRLAMIVAPLLVLAAAPSWASVAPAATHPAMHATFARQPGNLMIALPEAARVSDVTLRRSARATWRLAPATQGAAREVRVPLPLLMPGTYTASWQATGADGQAVAESVEFAVR